MSAVKNIFQKSTTEYNILVVSTTRQSLEFLLLFVINEAVTTLCIKSRTAVCFIVFSKFSSAILDAHHDANDFQLRHHDLAYLQPDTRNDKPAFAEIPWTTSE